MSIEFVTLDFETTGLRPGVDRVVEVGLVRTDANGHIIDEYSTLLNPHRDVGPTSIHGISASAVANAPSFQDVVTDLARFLNGAVLVAHNAKFDMRFLKMELDRTGSRYADLDPLCTLELMYLGYPSGPRRLLDCCAAFDLPCGHSHDALEDARMASNLLHFLLGTVPLPSLPSPMWIDSSGESSASAYPRAHVESVHRRQGSYLSRLVQQLNDESSVGVVSAVSIAQYLNFLDRVLEDRRITPEEGEELTAFARELGLGIERVSALHGAYVANLCAIAQGDGTVSTEEMTDLSQVAELLSVADWRELLEVPGKSRHVASKTSGLGVGNSVCFTGEMAISRDELTERSLRAGLVVKTGVSRKLDVLVIADADSMSAKAKKARELGVRMVAERVFLQMLQDIESRA